MGAGERNVVTSAISSVDYNCLHWNDVFSIIAQRWIQRWVRGLEVSNISSQQNRPQSVIFRSYSRPLPHPDPFVIQFDQFCF